MGTKQITELSGMKHILRCLVIVHLTLLLCVSAGLGHVGDHGAEPHEDVTVASTAISEKVIDAMANAHPPGSANMAMDVYIKRDGEQATFAAFRNYIQADVEKNEGPYLLSHSGVRALHIVAEYFGHIPDVAEYLINVAQEYDKYSGQNNIKGAKSLTPLIIWHVGQNHNQGVEVTIEALHSKICDGYESKRAVYDTLAHRFNNNMSGDEAALLFGYILMHEDDDGLVKEVNEYDNFEQIREASNQLRESDIWKSFLNARGDSIQPEASKKPSVHIVSSDENFSNLGILNYFLVFLFLIGVGILFFTVKAKCRV